MGIGQVLTTEKALGLSLADIELNEAFVAQTLAVARTGRIEPMTADSIPWVRHRLRTPRQCDRARILGTLLREMQRGEARYGPEPMRIARNQGLVAVFERIGWPLKTRCPS